MVIGGAGRPPPMQANRKTTLPPYIGKRQRLPVCLESEQDPQLVWRAKKGRAALCEVTRAGEFRLPPWVADSFGWCVLIGAVLFD